MVMNRAIAPVHDERPSPSRRRGNRAIQVHAGRREMILPGEPRRARNASHDRFVRCRCARRINTGYTRSEAAAIAALCIVSDVLPAHFQNGEVSVHRSLDLADLPQCQIQKLSCLHCNRSKLPRPAIRDTKTSWERKYSNASSSPTIPRSSWKSRSIR